MAGDVTGATAVDRSWTWWVAVLGGAGFLLFGLWALLAPQSFFDQLATFEPYNRHFVHDIGAFQLGLGAVLLLPTLFAPRVDAVTAALVGVGIGAVAHVVSHLLDIGEGGTPATDIPTFTLLAGVLLVAGIARMRDG